MSTDSSRPALRFHSASTCSDVVREESEADDLCRPTPAASPMTLSEPAFFPPSRREDAQNMGPSCVGNAHNSERVRKPVWGRASNGATDGEPLVMGGSLSWPPLSESAKASVKSSFDGSASSSGSAKSPPKQRMSAKIVGEGIGVGGVECNSSLSGTSGSTSSSLSSTVALSQDKTNKQLDKGSLANWEHGPRESHGSVDQGDRQRRHGGNGRRGSYGNRRDQGGGNQEWNSSRGLGGKGSYLQRGHPRQTVMQPPMPIMMPYIGPPLPLRPFPTPMAFPDFPPQMYYFPTHPYPEFFRGMPFVPPQSTPLVNQPMFFASPDHLRMSLLKQIEYYFSPENLCKDVFLRRNMDEHGWVPIHVIAGFNRVKQLTDNIQFILEAIRTSDVVEVEGNRVRRRDRWSEWIITPHQNQHATEPVYQSRENTNQESLVSRMDNISLGAGNGRANIENPSSLVDRPAP
ncbi:hypothetical protein HPP92_012530 [Vanilla planifolia]|uniref:HTH La-type RNA-binding domain-containing protein n=1 Tax=Vanilla planifolia TaxID=51239 RepID=A0A835QVC3_VANPL|nr:hypothetical protein HPP92_012530 [Vanilla planifolia]